MCCFFLGLGFFYFFVLIKFFFAFGKFTKVCALSRILLMMHYLRFFSPVASADIMVNNRNHREDSMESECRMESSSNRGHNRGLHVPRSDVHRQLAAAHLDSKAESSVDMAALYTL